MRDGNGMELDRPQCHQPTACRAAGLSHDGLESALRVKGFALTVFFQLLVREAGSGTGMTSGHGFRFSGFLTGVVNRDITRLKVSIKPLGTI